MESHIGITFLELRLPRRPLTIAGVVLHDAQNQVVVVKMRDRWEKIADAEDEEVLSEYEHGLVQLANELGAERFLEHLAANFSHTISPTLEYMVNRPVGSLDEYAVELLRQFQWDGYPRSD
jgi:hypothetical protein